jgi:ABC-type uncharacterized transport system permease subunit
MSALPIRRWTIVGLLVALFSGPLVSALFTVLRIPLTAQNVLFQTAILFACAAFLLFIIRFADAHLARQIVHSHAAKAMTEEMRPRRIHDSLPNRIGFSLSM